MLVVGFYVFVWLFFALVWWTAHLIESECLIGVTGFLDSLVLSISTANTIGYGVRAITPNVSDNCSCSTTAIPRN